jgi:plastocyanin
MRPFMRSALCLALPLAVALSSCGSGGQTTVAPPDTTSVGTEPVNTDLPPAPAPKYGSVDIVMKDIAYTPPKVSITAGDKVTWTNEDTVDHTATAESGADFDSGTLAPGESYAWKSTPGKIAYHCTIHPEMTGTINAKK